MYGDLNSIAQFLFDSMSSLVTLYMGGGLLTIAFAIRIVRRVSRLLDIIH